MQHLPVARPIADHMPRAQALPHDHRQIQIRIHPRFAPRPECPHRHAAMSPDVRWQQRFATFCQALDQLETFFQPPALNERKRQGLIKAFEYCFELGWNSLRDLLLAEGNADLIGSRDTLRLAFRVGLSGDGEGWLRMVQDRNLTSHTYNRVTAEQVSAQVEQRYPPCFRDLLLPWSVDLSLHHELPASLHEHVARVGRRLAS